MYKNMITKQDIVDSLLTGHAEALMSQAETFAPSNIALCKYWGKRNVELNLPITSSLSMSLGDLGSRCKISFCEKNDQITLNGEELSSNSTFVVRLSRYLDLFRKDNSRHYKIETVNTVPTAAGFASSASGFASIVTALNKLHGWNLTDKDLSILARLGSGSASRSLWQGFVEWHAGEDDEQGMDSYAEPFQAKEWPELKIGLLVLNAGKKEIGSRAAMRRTVETSELYKSWPGKVEQDLVKLKQAINSKDFDMLGATAESNALAMHATMMSAQPPVLYWQPESVSTMNKIWQCRHEGLPLYFTMDAGPNIKLLFLSKDTKAVVTKFPSLIT